MASLKKSLVIVNEGVSKNVQIVSAQAQDILKTTAIDFMRMRKSNPNGANALGEEFDEADSVLTWLGKMDKLAKEMPDIKDREKPAPTPAPSPSPAPAPPPQPAQPVVPPKALVTIEKDLAIKPGT